MKARAIPGSRRLGALWPLLLTAAILGLAVPGEAEFRNGVIWYTHAADEGTRALATRRFDLCITGRDVSDAAQLKVQRPDFELFLYNSATDNYVPPYDGEVVEHDALVALARARGWDPEEVYLHYYRDTRLVLQGDTLLIPGWTGGSATDPAQARVPVYTRELTRRAVNFSTPRARALNREVMLRLGLRQFSETTVYPDGLFLDNAAARLFNYGTIVSGGQILETPGHVSIESREFQSWHWTQNLGPFLAELKDTLEGSASWAPDHERKLLMINVANVWDDAYVSMDAADILFMEYQYNPIRNVGAGLVEESFRRDSLAAGAGIASFYAALTATSVSGVLGSRSYGETLLGNLAWYLVARTARSIFFEMGSSTPHAAGWDTLTWRGCLDVAEQNLGSALGPPYALARGKDPLGNAYVVMARNYERGLALVRNRGEWNQGIDDNTAVMVPLPAPMAPVSPAGKIGTAVEETRLRNGEGKLFLGDPGMSGKPGP